MHPDPVLQPYEPGSSDFLFSSESARALVNTNITDTTLCSDRFAQPQHQPYGSKLQSIFLRARNRGKATYNRIQIQSLGRDLPTSSPPHHTAWSCWMHKQQPSRPLPSPKTRRFEEEYSRRAKARPTTTTASGMTIFSLCLASICGPHLPLVAASTVLPTLPTLLPGQGRFSHMNLKRQRELSVAPPAWLDSWSKACNLPHAQLHQAEGAAEVQAFCFAPELGHMMGIVVFVHEGLTLASVLRRTTHSSSSTRCCPCVRTSDAQ